MPACNIQVLGARQRALLGASSKYAALHEGVIYQCDLVENATDATTKKKISRVLSSKLALAARIDSHGTHEYSIEPEIRGSAGISFRNQLTKKIQEWQTPPPTRGVRPLPVPDAGEIKKKRRGGRRARAYKKLFATSEVRKQANRVAFGEAVEPGAEIDDAADDDDMEGGTGAGFGMLGAGGSARSARAVSGRLEAENSKNSILKAANRRLERQKRSTNQGSGALALGLTSTINFGASSDNAIELGMKTPAPGGVSLANLNVSNASAALTGSKSAYFSNETPFSGMKSKK